MEKDALTIILKSGHRIELGPVTLGRDAEDVMSDLANAKIEGMRVYKSFDHGTSWTIDPSEIAFMLLDTWPAGKVQFVPDQPAPSKKPPHLRPADPGLDLGDEAPF